MKKRHDIKPVTPQDRENWQHLWKGYEQFYKAQFSDRMNDATWAKLLDPAVPVHGFLSFNQAEAIGLVHCIFHETTWNSAPYCYLQDLFVAPQARGEGVARQLIEKVVHFARQNKACRVYWLTHETNREARILYDKIATDTGFIQYRILLP